MLRRVLPIESVPNFSEGRDPRVLDALGEALESGGARVLDVHVDVDHNRSVFTTCGSAGALRLGLIAAATVAIDKIDVRANDGVHPHIGALDIVPVVPLDDALHEHAQRLVDELSDGFAALGLPVFLYADSGGGRRPHEFRRGGLGSLAERMKSGVLLADAGPAAPHARAGAVMLGVRAPLLAFNVNLATDRIEIAMAIARAVRERDGGLTGVRALGLPLASRGIVQISMNIERPDLTPIERVVAVIRQEAHTWGVALCGSELIGLMPAECAASAARHHLQIPELHAGSLLEVAIQRAGV
jgi:glutamate formiminotransferase / 5-formyltetrahydrofolate cyclo-ligase